MPRSRSCVLPYYIHTYIHTFPVARLTSSAVAYIREVCVLFSASRDDGADHLGTKITLARSCTCAASSSTSFDWPSECVETPASRKTLTVDSFPHWKREKHNSFFFDRRIRYLKDTLNQGTMGSPSFVDYDEVLKHIGQCGRWQWLKFFVLWLTSAIGGLAVVVYAFTAFKIPQRCAVPYCQETADASPYKYNATAFPAYVADKMQKSCELYVPEDSAPLVEPLSCQDYTTLVSSENKTGLVLKQCSEKDLIYDFSKVQTSLANDYGLICGESAWVGVLGATYMVGMLFGSFFFGLLSDHIGRLKTLMVAVLFVSVFGTLGAFMPDPYSFGFFRILTGMGGIGSFMITFVLAVEYVGPKYTMLIGIAIEIPFAIGELVLGLEAYLIRDWFTLQIVAYAPLLVGLVLWFIIPESPRWLLSKGRTEEAKEIIQKGAKINGRTFPEHLFHSPSGAFEIRDQASASSAQPTLLDLFRPVPIMLRSLNMFYQWFAVTMCYYGLSFASTSLTDDSYTNFCLSVFVEIPGYLFCLFVMDCWGRRPILSFCQIVSGVACILAGLLSGNSELALLQVVLSLIGKFGASACFAIVYVYAAELFPTVIRNTAIGSCSTVARVGGICALLLLGAVDPPYPMIVMGIVAVVAGVLAIFFPETVGCSLPETMDEAINIGKHSDRGLCTCRCPKGFSDDD